MLFTGLNQDRDGSIWKLYYSSENLVVLIVKDGIVA
jgi:hypothetical protein